MQPPALPSAPCSHSLRSSTGPATLGEPPQRWLARVRLERSAALLVESDDGLAGVAAAVGYDSEFAFSRAFRRQFGVAPGAYRRHLRKIGGSGSTGPVMRAA